MGEPGSPGEHVLRFLSVRADYERLAHETERLIRSRCKEHSLPFVSISSRAKEASSLENKIARRRYVDPLAEIHDLAGVRIVCSYQADADRFAEHIGDLFKVHWSENKVAGLGAHMMGYGGTHHVVSLGQGYAGGVYKGIVDLKCEIQVRTVLQDAWAIINHHLVYKNEDAVPDQLKRDLNNVASLLEVAQGVFDAVRQKRTGYEQEIEAKTSKEADFLSQNLDLETLTAYTRWKFPDLDVSSAWSNRLLGDLTKADYPTLRQLDAAVVRASAAIAAYKKQQPELFRYGTDHITKALGFVDERFRNKHGFAEVTLAAFERYRDLVTP